ncbi:DUF4129 domain-containing protein [Myroides fluvii]|uniref:DUF4129 domain-containing protein n=1 Tax=Myroides fluvii TaxID=2572594 RepID=UPI001E2D5DB7|nr:DUF4129 domain-containing protein [Myroides fluvii]
MNKHLNLIFIPLLFLFLFTAPCRAQTSEDDDCEDCPIEEVAVIQPVTTPKKVVATDSLYLLQDKNSVVNSKKFDTKFKNKYKNNQEFNYVKVEEKVGLFDRIKQAIEAWINRNFKQKVGQELGNFYYVVILRVLGFLLFGLVIYYLVRAFIQQDIYWLVKKKGKKISALENLTAEDFETTNFEQLVEEALQQQHYRLAIRLYYLWLLQRLQEQQKIKWAPEKTNADYTYEIKEEQEREAFTYLSYLYNNIWYGVHELTAADFAKAKNSFDSKLKTSKP